MSNNNKPYKIQYESRDDWGVPHWDTAREYSNKNEALKVFKDITQKDEDDKWRLVKFEIIKEA